jgi:penicillin-binding protein 1A
LAKNLYPRKERKKTNLVVDKIKEMFIAKRLEDRFSKEEILLHYLNTVSFGDNTFGVESASLRFFNKHASQLKIEEAATLVGMLKATYSYNPRLFPENSRARRNLVLQSMEKNGFLAPAEKDSLMAVPLVIDYREFDHNSGLAPYFREEVRKQLIRWAKAQEEEGKDYNIYTDGLKIYTTLNYKMQTMAETAMKAHMTSLQKQFEAGYGKNAPWNRMAILERAVHHSAPYKKWIEKGLTPQQAWDTLKTKRNMVLADWNGEKTVSASTIDSIQHYLKFLNTGSISIDPRTGAVMTWIGGIDFAHFKFDHVAQSRRQVGSTFKPFVYTTALEMGIAPCTYFSAQEVAYENLKGWSPSNSGKKDETFLNYSMEEGLSQSVNTVAVKVLERTGIHNVLVQAKKMGIFSELPNQPSLALGTGEIYVNELAGAYASFVNEGRAVFPYLIKTITDQNDSLLVAFEPKRAAERAFSKETGQMMLEMMKSTINRGTAARIRSTYKLKNDIAGKTGTTQNNKDAWFVGIMPGLVHVSWVGMDDHEIGFKSTTIGQGANAALPLFALWLQKMNADRALSPITQAKFDKTPDDILELMDCDPIKRDGFFKRLFKNPSKKKSRKFNSNDNVR